jgi:ABC-type sugar transport system ATPase subunit
MVGAAVRRHARASQDLLQPGPASLEVSELSVDGATEVSFQVAAGECIGLTGLAGSGKEAIAEAIAGLRRIRAGRITVAGSPLLGGGVAAAQRAGISSTPE